MASASAYSVHQEKKVIICGGGVIGASIAYYLTKRGVKPIIIDRCKELCSASAKAGGFLARNWSDDLGAKSFDIHAKLAKELNNVQDYRRLHTLQVFMSADRLEGGLSDDANWVDGVNKTVNLLGTPTETAQVHPRKLTNALLRGARSRGARLLTGRIHGLVVKINGSSHAITGVKVDGQVIPCDECVLALGPWTGRLASAWLCNSATPLPTIGVTASVDGKKYASITMQSPPSTKVSAHALFTDSVYDVEVYPRPDGEVYLCGCHERGAVLPEDPTTIAPKESAMIALEGFAAQLSSALATVPVKAKQACFLPTSKDGEPIIGRLPGVHGVMVATAHSCWGILKAPGTGIAITQLILDGKCTLCDLRRYDPSRGLAKRKRTM